MVKSVENSVTTDRLLNEDWKQKFLFMKCTRAVIFKKYLSIRLSLLNLKSLDLRSINKEF